MSRGGCGAENSVEDTEERAAKAAALKAKQDKAEVAKAAKAAKQKRRKLLGLRWHWLLPQFNNWLDDLKSEWRGVVKLVVEKRDGRWKRKTYNDLWAAVYQHNEAGNVAKFLIEIEMAIALDTALMSPA